MRHRMAGVKLGRDTKHRQALYRNQLRSLVEYGFVVTTQAKAKQLKRLADRVVSQAQGADLAGRRQLHRQFGKRDVVNTLVDRVAPQFKRQTGFVRLKPVGRRRGDNTLLVRVEFIKQLEKLGTLRSGNAKPAQSSTQKASSKKGLSSAKSAKTAKTTAKSSTKSAKLASSGVAVPTVGRSAKKK